MSGLKLMITFAVIVVLCKAVTSFIEDESPITFVHDKTYFVFVLAGVLGIIGFVASALYTAWTL